MMYPIMRYILLFSLYFLSDINLLAQPVMTGFADIGHNNISEVPFIRTSVLGNYQIGKNNVVTGFQADLLSTSSKILSAYTIKAGRELSIRNFPFEIQAFYLYSSYTDVLYETNVGLTFNFQWDHLKMQIGNNFRTFALTKKIVKKYEIEEDAARRIYEKWNLMYMFGYYLKQLENPWNVGLSLTNTDYFIINQETNPVVYLQGLYKMDSRLSLFSEIWYKSAGAFNLNVNYFGFSIRTGVIWDIK